MKQLTRRQVLRGMAALGLATAGSGLAACGATPTPAAGEPTTAAVSTTEPQGSTEQFSINVLETWAEAYLQYMQANVEPALKEKWPGITVNYVPMDWGTLEEKLLTGAASGAMPDVFRQGAEWAPTTSKTALPLDDRVEQWGAKSDFPEGPWSTVTWAGKVWGIPQLTTPQYWCYRKDLTDEEGVTIPDDWDFDDYLEAAKALTKFEGEKVVRKGCSTGSDWQGGGFCTMLLCAGGKFTEGGKTAFVSEEGIWALSFMVERNNAVGPQGYSPLQSSEIPYFALGLEVIEYGHPGWWETQVQQYASDKVQYIAVPNPPLKAKRVATVFTDWLAIGKTTKHADAAWEFVRLNCEKDALIEFNRGAGYLPPRQSAMAEAQYVKDSAVLSADAEHLQEYGVALPRWPKASKLNQILTTELEAASLKQKTPEESLQTAAKEWDTVLVEENWQD